MWIRAFFTVVTLVTVPFTLFAQTVDRQACQMAYSTSVTQCAQGLDFLEPATRAGAQKACVQGAKLKRDICMAGTPPPTCQDSCQAAYNISVSSCESSYDPASCGGNLFCEGIISSQRAACIGNATNALNSCTAACPIQN